MIDFFQKCSLIKGVTPQNKTLSSKRRSSKTYQRNQGVRNETTMGGKIHKFNFFKNTQKQNKQIKHYHQRDFKDHQREF